jgi:hypothetical protein
MSEPDKEVAAIAVAFDALRVLDDLAQQRAVQWLASRFAADAFARAKPAADGSGKHESS